MQQVLDSYKIRPQKKFGQNFLADESVLQREVGNAHLSRSDVVLEIGAGIGNLTELLLQRAGQVIAIEADRQFEKRLGDLQGEYDNLEIIWGDALEVDFPAFDKVVANLPYKVALPLTFKLLDCKFDRGILMYQKQLAQRLCATVGQNGYSRLGVSISRRANAELLEVVDRAAFYPQPDVDSAMVELQCTKPKFDIPSEDFFKEVLERLFAQRQKSVQQAVRGFRDRKMTKAALERALANMGARVQKRQVSSIMPRDFGHITWALWGEAKRQAESKRGTAKTSRSSPGHFRKM
jgi:16S rRNA (adenine1518-N6/adenine1519-N6)-dimethyltransferase